MYTLIIGIILFCAILLIVAILAQNSKGGGLSSQFGGSGASNMFGVKKTGDFLEKASWTLAIAIIVLSMSTNIDFVTAGSGNTENGIIDKAGEEAPAGSNVPMTPPTIEEGGNETPAGDSTP